MENLINVLLVEDDEVDVMNVKRSFKKNCINNPLYVAKNGLEALNMLSGKDPDNYVSTPRIVLLDINMPKMGGIEFLTELRKDPALKPTTVFVMTTSNEDSDKIAAYNLNVAGYILKPLSFDGFVNAVSILNHYWQLCELPETSDTKILR